MIEWVIEWSIRHRWIVVSAAVAMALAGWYAANQTPVDAIPDLSENQVIVFTSWAGHAPQEIEDQVTFPLSAQLRGIDGVVTVRGNSELNFSAINVVFSESVGIAEARDRVQAKLSQVTDLPPGIRAELAPEAPATGQIFWYALVAPQWDLARLRSLQDTAIRPQLSTVSGVAEVASVGGFHREYRIAVDPEKLAARRISPVRLCQSLESLDSTVGSRLIAAKGTELVVHAEPILKSSGADDDPNAILDKLKGTFLAADTADQRVRLDEVAQVTASPVPRRGVFEMDGVETVGGVVMMRYGANPLEVTERLERKIEEIESGLPYGVSILTVYDRVRLVHSAVGTVSTTMIEAMITASLCVVFVLLHFRTSLVIVLALPLTVLGSFLMLWGLRSAGWFDARTNIMSLAGLVISIGVLVDASVVMAENVVHTLRERFGDQPVRGDVRDLIAQACKSVGRPTFFSVLIMLLSFFPVFALYGIEGKMFRPLALTKSLALIAAAVLAITVVPVLCTFFVRGRLRKEVDSWIVRSTLEVYRPVLTYLLERPAVLAWLLGMTFILGFAPLGSSLLTKLALAAALGATGVLAHTWRTRGRAWVTLLLAALLAQQHIQPLAWERIPPLDEGTAMDMPITLPRISVSQATDDLKMRDMVLCRFPEVDMVMGKAGRAETATDPAPIDMIETMVMFRPHELWPRRQMRSADAQSQVEAIREELVRREIIAPDRNELATEEIASAVQPRFDALMREYCYHRNKQHLRETDLALRTYLCRRLFERLEASGQLARSASPGDIARLASAVDHRHGKGSHTPTQRELRRAIRAAVAQAKQLGLTDEDADVLGQPPGIQASVANSARALVGQQPQTLLTLLTADLQREHDRLWRKYAFELDRELVDRAAGTYTRLVAEEILSRVPVASAEVRSHRDDLTRARAAKPPTTASGGHHHGVAAPQVRRSPILDGTVAELTNQFASSLVLKANDRTKLGSFRGEMDEALQMPGWTNVWTRPIQNRVDMLATGVNTDIGICVMGQRLDDVVATSERIAQVVHHVHGAQQVVADPIRGKPYLKVTIDERKVAKLEIPLEDVQSTLQLALAGKVVAHTLEGRQRHAVRVVLDGQSDDEARRLRETPLLIDHADQDHARPTLGDVVELKYEEGPTCIKSENGLLRNYVRLNVAQRDPQQFIDDARQAIAEHVEMPAGVFLQWTGQFEHQQQSKQRIALLLPIVLALIFGLLVWTYHDVADAALMLLALPGALAGGLFMQWLLGTNLSVTVLVGYIACFGMAASTGIIMLVYLRDAVARAGGLENLTLPQLKSAVLKGAVQRLRPKLLTEATAIISIAPMLWASGVGSEVIRPMAAPVLGGILIADEVIDLFLPVAFYWVRRWRWNRLHQREASDGDSAEDDTGGPISPARQLVEGRSE